MESRPNIADRKRGALLRDVADRHKLRVSFLTGAETSRHEDIPGIVEEIRSRSPLGESTRLGAGVSRVRSTPCRDTAGGIVG